MLTKTLREPLVHFVLIGAAVFGLYALVTGDGREHARDSIVVTDGRISQVLRERASPAGAEIVDLAGHTCMPGWIDLHVHLSQESNPDSYSERFRLDDADFAYRSVGYAEKTLLHLHTLWGREVALETVINGKKMILGYGEQGFSSRAH